MTAHAAIAPPPTRRTLLFGALGGGVAWLLHLLLAYLIAEFGCIASLGHRYLLGLTGVAWLILIASGLMILLALAATATALISHRRISRPKHHDTAVNTPINILGNAHYLAQAGWIANLLFLVIIIAQTIPIFYYLRSC